MAIKTFVDREENPREGLLLIEKAMLAYLAFTLVLVIVFWNSINAPLMQVANRGLILAMTVGLWLLYRKFPCKVTRYARSIAQFTLLPYWYSNTYDFNCLLPNLDHIMASAEQSIFGCQPAYVFSQVLTGSFWSEAFNLGYVAYFPMIMATELYYLFGRTHKFERAAFVVMASFFIYYVVFIFVPVAGPQYYYCAIGLDSVAQANFVDVGNYFASHTEMLTAPGDSDGLFYNLVLGSQNAGERPTAAFPSSHVGISTIQILICLRDKQYKMVFILLPFYVMLCCATVYIQAHYLIDVIGGWISAVLVYALTAHLYKMYAK